MALRNQSSQAQMNKIINKEINLRAQFEPVSVCLRHFSFYFISFVATLCSLEWSYGMFMIIVFITVIGVLACSAHPMHGVYSGIFH